MIRAEFRVLSTLIASVAIIAWTPPAPTQTNGTLPVTAKPGEWRYLNADPQAWFELGLVGVLLLAMAGVCIVMLIPLLPRSAQPFAAGTFATFAVIGAFSWGMWQAWFMCEVALLPVLLPSGKT